MSDPPAPAPRRRAPWRAALIAAALLTTALGVWRAQLFQVSAPGEAPRALAARPPGERPAARFDVMLRAVPVGMRRLAPGDGVLLVHYWAPWERHGATQAALLDSLRRAPGLAGLDVVVVAFDPFPGVARYVARRRLGVPVLLDHGRALRDVLPCPSIPYTYVLDRAGRVAVAQPGEVDWFASGTRRALEALLAEPPAPAPGTPAPAS